MTKIKSAVLSRAQLRSRGWTDSGIQRFLGHADSKRPNPFNRSIGPMQLWATSRVEAVEASADCAAWLQSSRKRRVESEAVSGPSRRAEGAQMVDAVVIDVEQVDLDDVRECAIESYNERTAYEAARFEDAQNWHEATVDNCDPEFIDHITVNFLRYDRTSYDAMGENLFRLVGRREAHELLCERVLGVIAAEYPSLATECSRQLDGIIG